MTTMTRRQTNGRERALLVLFEQYYDSYRDDRNKGGDNDGQQLWIKAHMVTCDPDGSSISNSSRWGDDGEPRTKGIISDDLHGFWVRCTADRRDGLVRYENQKVEYADLLTIDSRHAAGMVKVFKTVERDMEKAAHKYGWHTSTGQYIVRVASAIGATRIIVRKPDMTPGSTYDENAAYYDHYAPHDALAVINLRIAGWAAGAREIQAVRSY